MASLRPASWPDLVDDRCDVDGRCDVNGLHDASGRYDVPGRCDVDGRADLRPVLVENDRPDMGDKKRPRLNFLYVVS